MSQIASLIRPRLAVLALMVLIAGCGGHKSALDPPMPDLPPPPSAAPKLDPAALAAPRWSAVLAAGDITLHVADDAVEELDERFQRIDTPIERLHVLSPDKELYLGGFASPDEEGDGSDREGRADRGSRSDDRAAHLRRLPGGTEPARPAIFLDAVLELQAGHGGGCFVYLASTPDGGAMNMVDGTISPEQLDRALAGGCATAPTVVVVSGCDSGAFAEPPMTRPNRLIMTAAARGKSGFGCGPNRGLTTFDECFIGALDGSARWVDVFDRTTFCVARREKLVGQAPADPQTRIGADVAALPSPWQNEAGPGGITHRAEFRRGVGRFTLDGVPYFSTLKARTRPAFEAYARAATPKALALTFAGTVVWTNSTVGETPDDVSRLALQRCEWESGGPCVLYARNDDLAAVGVSGQAAIHSPTLARTGTVDAATVPFIRDDQRGQIDSYRRLAAPKALALGPDRETIGVAAGATPGEARAAALSRCGAGCVLYAEDDQVILGAK